MSTSTPMNSSGAAPSLGARAQRLAWFGAGAVAAVASFAVLDSAFATTTPVSPLVASPVVAAFLPTPSLLLPAAPLRSAALLPQGGGTTGSGNQAGDVVRSSAFSTASGVSGDSNNRMIAVTGNDITGQSVLYLVDTIDKQLAVYQASGGAPGTQNVKLVGARNISLDLKLDGLNDRTEVDKQPLTFKDLERRFGKSSNKTTPSGAPR